MNSFCKLIPYLVVAVAFLMEACTQESQNGLSSDIKVSADREREGFLYVNASGKSAELGTKLSTAKASERPVMKVLFDYDFSIGKHEVTCEEYWKYMDAPPCEGWQRPITDITYYDAILYANARSKAEKYDTVYTYQKLKCNDRGRQCSSMEGLTFHPEVNGYRLPTEAEWVLVAGVGWNTQEGWTASNSENRLHDVCKKRSLYTDACDMVGNAMEWVNDWAGSFRDTTVTNYVGGTDGGAVGERVIKGGSFKAEPSAINLYSRGDIYSVVSATHAYYVGFRLAFGAIPNPVWLGKDGSVVAKPVVPLANAASIRSFTGTNKAKLAFRNDENGRLVYVDYSSSILSAVEIVDSLGVYHPDISPDGKMVAYSTGMEGVAGKSSIYVRALDSKNEKPVKLDVESAVIPRWRVLDSGDTVIVYVTDAGNNKTDADFLARSTWQVSYSKGKFGTPQKLLDGNYHGGISTDDRLAVTGARLLRARVADSVGTIATSAHDAIWYNGEQACNVSLSTDGSKRTLFLDFGGETGMSFVGEKYGVHEQLLIADSTGKLIQSVAAPEGYSFDHTEWVRGSESFVVASLTNLDGAHKKLALLNLKDGSMVELVSGEELWHPSMWIKPISHEESSVWTNDSVGAYYAEGQFAGGLLSQKMPMFWKYKDSIELVGLGSSRVWAGFNPESLSVRGINMGTTPCDMHCIYYLEKNYVINHYSKLKYIMISLDLDLWNTDDEMLSVNMNVVGGAGYAYDEKHDFWENGVDESFVKKILDDASDDDMAQEERMGWLSSGISRGWYDTMGNAELADDSTWSDNRITYESDMEKLRLVIELAKNNNIKVIGVIFPQSPAYSRTGAFGRHGMRRSVAKDLIEEIQKLEYEFSNFVLLDENSMGNHKYGNEMALDFDHLNDLGAVKLVRRINYAMTRFE